MSKIPWVGREGDEVIDCMFAQRLPAVEADTSIEQAKITTDLE